MAIIQSASPPAEVLDAPPKHRFRFNPVPYLFVAPQLVLFAVFMFFPLAYAGFLSLHSWEMFAKPRFVGMRNYNHLINDPIFWYALRNTLVYVVGTVPLCIGFGLLLALGLNRSMPLRRTIRSIFFLPVVVSAVVTALAAIWIFNDNYGLLNRMFGAIGLPRINWNADPQWAMVSLIITTIWLRSGFCMIIYLAALQSVPVSLHEAAQIDGASPFERFLHVTWPSMRPTTLLLTILNVIYSFHVFDLIFVMTGGGPGYSTTVLVQYIYQLAFTNGDMGYASAVGMALFVMILAFTIIQWLLSRRSEING
ncbi:carbohydrate ABC transporter permease [uncultured Devosia sp.]|uniref:carbohydrate ABC transporter permease n=1 Tax=uncultured Devosia sp. TaxID=211434 RepID=UPI0035CAD074